MKRSMAFAEPGILYFLPKLKGTLWISIWQNDAESKFSSLSTQHIIQGHHNDKTDHQ